MLRSHCELTPDKLGSIDLNQPIDLSLIPAQSRLLVEAELVIGLRPHTAASKFHSAGESRFRSDLSTKSTAGK